MVVNLVLLTSFDRHSVVFIYTQAGPSLQHYASRNRYVQQAWKRFVSDGSTCCKDPCLKRACGPATFILCSKSAAEKGMGCTVHTDNRSREEV